MIHLVCSNWKEKICCDLLRGNLTTEERNEMWKSGGFSSAKTRRNQSGRGIGVPPQVWPAKGGLWVEVRAGLRVDEAPVRTATPPTIRHFPFPLSYGKILPASDMTLKFRIIAAPLDSRRNLHDIFHHPSLHLRFKSSSLTNCKIKLLQVTSVHVSLKDLKHWYQLDKRSPCFINVSSFYLDLTAPTKVLFWASTPFKQCFSRLEYKWKQDFLLAVLFTLLWS